MPPHDAALPPDVRKYLKQFLEVQHTRARKYAELRSGFQCLLTAQNMGMYNTMMGGVTEAFNDCSQQAISIEKSLKDQHNRQDLAGMIRTVQNHERDKLRLTLVLQTLKASFNKKAFSWQHVDPAYTHDDDDDDVDPLDAHAGHNKSEDGRCSCQALEPTEAEYNAAVQEAMVIINEAIVGINEVMGDITCMLQEEADDQA